MPEPEVSSTSNTTMKFSPSPSTSAARRIGERNVPAELTVSALLSGVPVPLITIAPIDVPLMKPPPSHVTTWTF